MLTPEEKARIDEEEGKRHSQEQYRQEVRANLRQSSEMPLQAKSSINSSVLKVLGALTILVALLIVLKKTSRSRVFDEPPPPQPTVIRAPIPLPTIRYIDRTQQIASGQIVIKHSGYVSYKIVIEPEMGNPVLSGNFNASGGNDNDIAVAIVNESNIQIG